MSPMAASTQRGPRQAAPQSGKGEGKGETAGPGSLRAGSSLVPRLQLVMVGDTMSPFTGFSKEF